MTSRNVLRAAALFTIGASILTLLNGRLVPALLLATAGVFLVMGAGKTPPNRK